MERKLGIAKPQRFTVGDVSLGDAISAHESTVLAVEVAQTELSPSRGEFGMMARYRLMLDNDIIVESSSQLDDAGGVYREAPTPPIDKARRTILRRMGTTGL